MLSQACTLKIAQRIFNAWVCDGASTPQCATMARGVRAPRKHVGMRRTRDIVARGAGTDRHEGRQQCCAGAGDVSHDRSQGHKDMVMKRVWAKRHLVDVDSSE